jgi:hypothetical protein
MAAPFILLNISTRAILSWRDFSSFLPAGYSKKPLDQADAGVGSDPTTNALASVALLLFFDESASISSNKNVQQIVPHLQNFFGPGIFLTNNKLLKL